MRGPYTVGYDPPASSRGRPEVITWFRVYAATTAVLCVAIVLFCLSLGAEAREGTDELLLVLVGASALGFATAYAVGALVPFKPWAWTFGLILICLGLSGCMMVFAIPILVYWLKPQTKAAFCLL